MQNRLKRSIFCSTISEKLPEICDVPVGRKSIRTYVPMFWSVFSSKNIYKINENTSLSLEKTLHQDDNLLRRKAFDGSHPKGLLMARDTLIYLLQSSGFLINIQKSVLNPTSTFGIFRSATNSRHDIESPKRENFENAATMQKDSELAINLNQSTKPINRQTSFHSSSNSSSTTTIQGFATQPDSWNVIKEFYGVKSGFLRTSKKGN